MTHRDRTAVPSARKPRQVLSALLLSEGEVVSTDALISEIWDTRPPKSVQTTLQTYVMQVRKHLSRALRTPAAEIAGEVLITRNGGYTLELHGATVDLYEYRSLERAGMTALEMRDDEQAVRVFDQALALWRGRALADVELGRVLEPEVARLERSRLTIVESRLEAELRRGRHRESLSELTSLTARYSYNENLHALYMLALYRSGLRSKALEIYRELRAWMIEELGIEPSPRLQQLHHALLTGAPELDELSGGWTASAREEETAGQRDSFRNFQSIEFAAW
ncbi:BTAD domain-containing putative transcriptional regulator [Actinomadura sp. 1N219]|uniref:AfsR/SARP family transcriptional regulator n=1 Tax=Actinomadura sp. 1N219 TaxID=3375152 RepID=UPI0037B03E88